MSTCNEKEVGYRIFIVDDHPIVRDRLGELISEQPDLIVCGSAEGARSAMLQLCIAKPHLAIVDLSLKDSHGIELIKEMSAQMPQLPILVVSMHDESLYAERVLRSGARGYITKREATAKILEAIRKVLGGEIYLSDAMVKRVLNHTVVRRGSTGSPILTLADRELEVLNLTGRGWTTRQIANDIRVSLKTVESYKARIKEKLNIETANQLTHYAINWVADTDRKLPSVDQPAMTK